ncbi:MAG TPA: indole-3-glycerol phosphate synthase TrpC [Solirubrobacteraceae bacterium]|jgi:indole-3-glycerol phosphate synthase|nr:indole-3-glycerol phosphate synthase TrpC [Solirubrobacteraceae bacterium]
MSGATPSVLARIVQSTREELARRKRERPLDALQALVDRKDLASPAAEREPGRFRRALAGERIAVIAEFKRRSPSAGSLREEAKPEEIVAAYERGGASALSVLTEGPNFGGSLDDVRVTRGASTLPILRKDFVVDRYQLLEARLADADAVLLIVAALSDAELAELHADALALGLDVLVEVHDADEVDRALALDPATIGVNNRDLRDFSVDVGRTRALRAAIPTGVAVVSESGIGDAEQLRELERDGVDAVLVGESLMRAPDPTLALRALLGGVSEARAR